VPFEDQWDRQGSRDCPGGDAAEGIERDNLVLLEWFQREYGGENRLPFDVVYVNGGTTLGTLQTPHDTWQLRLIEEDFHRLMFAVEGE
jgi:adenine-specific DNA-methyltransferase